MGIDLIHPGPDPPFLMTQQIGWIEAGIKTGNGRVTDYEILWL